MIHVADSVSAEAATDVALAYGSLSTVTCDSVIGVTMGNDQVLFPNVYCTGAASTINGDLILDAQGNPDAIFMFKIEGAMASSADSRIILINGASLCNVYWQVNGQVDLGANSIFQGILLVNGAINLLDGATLEGQALSQVGAITLNNNTVTIGECTTLPIELLHFDAIALDRKVQISWSTAAESNNDYFTIQRSINGLRWEELSNINGAGNSSTLLNIFLLTNSRILEFHIIV